ncbi:MAG: Fe(3+)-hydroxamate ABC transporter permease FhuB [Proteobacteria bacterium]|nr:Fe(3+)-hydroxamate ABC transporter permease FhuB [Pseudomonadota bacterium]
MKIFTPLRHPSTQILLLMLLSLLYLQIATPLSITDQLHTLSSAAPLSFEHISPPALPLNFDQIEYLHGSWPRLILALVLGAALAVSGSLLQQLTQNVLVSPMTIGASSGAWLAVVLASILMPALLADYGEWLALGGATLAVGLVLLLAGWTSLQGMPLILAGMAINILLGATAALAVMMNDQYTRSLFIWGAGDLAQNDWHWVSWCLPRLLPVLILIPLLQRPLQLMRLGSGAARSAGMQVGLASALIFLASLWLTAVSITAVGLIAFISLLAPNLARLSGARSSRAELALSAFYGALFLLAGDALALLASNYFTDAVPSGAAVSLLGAPGLIWLCLRQRVVDRPSDYGAWSRSYSPKPWQLAALVAIGMLLLCIACLASRSSEGWVFALPDALQWSLRWPRLLAAMAAGLGLAMAGCVLQRLMQNPLASPDLLGISSGASLGLLIAICNFPDSNPASLAWLGAMAILILMFWLGKRHSPAKLILLGVGLSSMLEAILQFVLAKGDADSFRILSWLAGSTYQVSPKQALISSALIIILGLATLLCARVLSLLMLGDDAARARGLAIAPTRMILLMLSGSLCAIITSQFGPLAFIGLMLPHLAKLCGARSSKSQLIVAAGLGIILLACADLAGRTLIFPRQIPVGIVASVSCGALLILALLTMRIFKEKA